MHSDGGLAFVAQVPGQLLKIDLVQLETTNSSDFFVSVLESLKPDRWDFARVEGARWCLNQRKARCLLGIYGLVGVYGGDHVRRVRAIPDALEDCVFSDGLSVSGGFGIQDGVEFWVDANETTFHCRGAFHITLFV